ncbi:DUF2267 domain-containing protein [Streptomyces goshikiensis]|uniref:DUF2267 domain-containing protein n=1 Tax=Streptomyces goshikiensis TaxID=1942 RepID=UPI0036A840C6
MLEKVRYEGAYPTRERAEEAVRVVLAGLGRQLTGDERVDLARCLPHTNGLLRQYFPKGTDLSRWSPHELESVAGALNNRPRKTLGWRTPTEVFNEHLSSPTSSVATIP